MSILGCLVRDGGGSFIQSGSSGRLHPDLNTEQNSDRPVHRALGESAQRSQAQIGARHGEGLEFYIRTTPEHLWEAITNPEIRSQYNFGAGAYSDLQARVAVDLTAPRADRLLAEGEVLEVDPPRRLVHTMVALWSGEVRSEGVSRVTWEIEPVGDSCHLTVTHGELREGANAEITAAALNDSLGASRPG